MSFFITAGNIATETNGIVVVPLALGVCVWIQAYFPRKYM